jgi:hypothetical protein
MPGFEEFVRVARSVVEAEAREHADDRFWVLEPMFVVRRRDGSMDIVLASEVPEAVRAIADHGLVAGLESLNARRYGLTLHADLELDGEIVPVIVLGVAGALATSYQYVRVERTQAGLPRLGEWEPAPGLADEFTAAVARLTK